MKFRMLQWILCKYSIYYALILRMSLSNTLIHLVFFHYCYVLQHGVGVLQWVVLQLWFLQRTGEEEDQMKQTKAPKKKKKCGSESSRTDYTGRQTWFLDLKLNRVLFLVPHQCCWLIIWSLGHWKKLYSFKPKVYNAAW